jgi:menaquinol-cytochrome c reductase iron-sulfur subunit
MTSDAAHQDQGAEPQQSAPESPLAGNGGDRRVMRRRRLLTAVSLGVGGLIGLAIGVPWIGYVIGPWFDSAPETWVTLGKLDDFQIGTTTFATFIDQTVQPWSGQSANTAVWVRRTGVQDFTVFDIHCAHLGCPVNWIAGAQLFECPCHGGVYYADGSVAAGPPPRGLFTYQTRIENGTLQARTRPLPVA